MDLRLNEIVAPAVPNDGNDGTSSVESLTKYSHGEEALDLLSDPEIQMHIATKRAALDLRFASRSQLRRTPRTKTESDGLVAARHVISVSGGKVSKDSARLPHLQTGRNPSPAVSGRLRRSELALPITAVASTSFDSKAQLRPFSQHATPPTSGSIFKSPLSPPSPRQPGSVLTTPLSARAANGSPAVSGRLRGSELALPITAVASTSFDSKAQLRPFSQQATPPSSGSVFTSPLSPPTPRQPVLSPLSARTANGGRESRHSDHSCGVSAVLPSGNAKTVAPPLSRHLGIAVSQELHAAASRAWFGPLARLRFRA